MTFFTPHLPVVKPATASFFATDFSEYPLGAQPPGWSKSQAVADFSVSVVTDAEAHSGKSLRWTRTGGGRQVLLWDVVPPATDVEILMRCENDPGGGEGTFFGGVLARVGDAASLATFDAYFTAFFFGSSSQFWHRGGHYLNGTVTAFSDAGIGGGAYPWMWLRMRLVGTTFTRNVWRYTEAETLRPERVVTDSAIAGPGQVGLILPGGGPDIRHDYFAVSIGGPGFPPKPIPLPF